MQGLLYCNDGDWVDSLTALVEHADGRLEILDYSARAAVHRLPARLKGELAATAPAQEALG